MAYTFSKTDGTAISVNDNQIDQTTYSLTLLGKNVTNYGQIIAQNTIRQLENFAGPSQPTATIKLTGQLWYDTTGKHLKVYRGTTSGFTELAYRPKLLSSSPTDDIQSGELYYDTTEGDLNLKIYNGSAWVNVIGTEYIEDLTAAQLVTNGTHTNITATYDDNNDGAIDLVISDATIRSKFSATDSGGDGSFAYNSSTGVFTYTGPSAAEVRAHFSGGTGVTYNSGTGVIAIGQAVETTSDVTFNNATIDGNLTVNGTQTILNTETLTVDDNLIVLNNNEAGTPSANAGIEVERGTSTNVQLRWNESGDYWEVTRDGSTYEKIYTESEIEGFFSATDAGGDGSFAYNGAGVFTYTGPSTSEVRAHFSAGTNTTYSGGQFSISDATIRSKISVTNSSGDGSLSYNSTSGVITYTGPSASEVRAHLSGSSGVNYNSTTGAITADTSEIRGMFSAGGDLSYDSSTGTFSFTNDAGDIESVGAGTGMTGGGTSGAVTLNVIGGDGITANADDIAVDLSDTAIFTSTNTASRAVVRDGSGNFAANIITGTATQARYADLAELYLADTDYEEGTVLVFGGDAEVTTSDVKASPSIAGVVSHNPAYLMNSELQGDHVTAVALKGRVPVKVVGAVSKGDVLVHSTTPGHAEAAVDNMNVNGPSCIGIAITEKSDEGAGIVEALVK